MQLFTYFILIYAKVNLYIRGGGTLFVYAGKLGNFDQLMITEEVGQLIRRIWANLSTNQIAPFSSCSHEAFGIENFDFFHIVMHIFWKFHAILLLQQSIYPLERYLER